MKRHYRNMEFNMPTKDEIKLDQQRLNAGMTRAERREEYRMIRLYLHGSTPADTLANVRSAVEQWNASPRRPGDAPDTGCWIPAFALSAVPQVLKSTVRAMEVPRG
jgi:hypothetical protein